DDDRNLAALTSLDDRHRAFRRGEVDDDVRAARQGQLRRDRNAQRADAGQVAGVAALVRMSGGINGRDDGQLVVLVSQHDDPLAHPPARPVDRDVCLHGWSAAGYVYTSIALMISSRSFDTCTARLAKFARRTPRLPSTSSNVFGSAEW